MIVTLYVLCRILAAGLVAMLWLMWASVYVIVWSLQMLVLVIGYAVEIYARHRNRMEPQT